MTRSDSTETILREAKELALGIAKDKIKQLVKDVVIDVARSAIKALVLA